MSTLFNVPTKEQVSPANQAIFDNLQKAVGFVPNIYAAVGYSNEGLGRYLTFQDGKSSLSNKEREAVNLVTSSVNGCVYCQSAHTVIAKMNGFSEAQTIEIRKGHCDDSKINALVELAADITRNNGHGSELLVSNFFAAGYNKENLVDLILQIVSISATNYLHNITQVPVDFPLAQAL